MSFFGGKQKKKKPGKEGVATEGDDTGKEMTSNGNTANGTSTHPGGPPDGSQKSKPKLVFHCQQAHGSPTGLISGFTNVKELYQRIADCYDFPVDSVCIFC